MQGLFRAIARLLVMGFVMAAVLATAVYAGLAVTTALAVGVVLAGVVGLVGVARRPRARQRLTAAEQIEAMMANDPSRAQRPAPTTRPTAIEAMAPPVEVPVDPEAGVPRWRRRSLIEARHSDPTRDAPVYRLPMRFGDGGSPELDVRVVRYAVVPVLDRPDEVLGLQLSDLAAGDEIQVLNTSGAFIEVLCPNGDRGWVHRTTVGQRGPAGLAGTLRQAMPQEADDALTALLSARGLI